MAPTVPYAVPCNSAFILKSGRLELSFSHYLGEKIEVKLHVTWSYMHDLCAGLCFPSTTFVPFLLTPLPLRWPPCHPFSSPGMLPANSMWLLYLEGLHLSASGFPERPGYHPGRMRIWEEGGLRHQPLPSSHLSLPQQGQKPNCHLGKDRVNLIWASRPCSRWFVLFLKKKKKNRQPVCSCLETWTFWKYRHREGAAPRRRFSARGVMLIQCDRGIFFLRPGKQRVQIALLGVSQAGCKLRKPSVGGDVCVAGVLGSPPPPAPFPRNGLSDSSILLIVIVCWNQWIWSIRNSLLVQSCHFSSGQTEVGVKGWSIYSTDCQPINMS